MLTEATGDDTPAGSTLQEVMECARAHGEVTDTRQWLDNLERLMQVAWDIMTPTQRQAFSNHAEVVAIVDAAGRS